MLGSKTVLGCTHVIEQLSFSMIPSILTVEFYLILVSILTFGGTKGRLKKNRKFSELGMICITLINATFFYNYLTLGGGAQSSSP